MPKVDYHFVQGDTGKIASPPAPSELAALEAASRKWRRAAIGRFCFFAFMAVGIAAVITSILRQLNGETTWSWRTALDSSAFLDVDATGAYVTTNAQMVAGVAVALVVAPRIARQPSVYDQMNLAQWLRAAAAIIQASSTLSLSLSILTLQGSTPQSTTTETAIRLSPGYQLTLISLIALTLASVTSRRAQDVADTAEIERSLERARVRLNKLRDSGAVDQPRPLSLLLAIAPALALAALTMASILVGGVAERDVAPLLLLGAVLACVQYFYEMIQFALLARGHATAFKVMSRGQLYMLFGSFPVTVLLVVPAYAWNSYWFSVPWTVSCIFTLLLLADLITYAKPEQRGRPFGLVGHASMALVDTGAEVDRLNRQLDARPGP